MRPVTGYAVSYASKLLERNNAIDQIQSIYTKHIIYTRLQGKISRVAVMVNVSRGGPRSLSWSIREWPGFYRIK